MIKPRDATEPSASPGDAARTFTWVVDTDYADVIGLIFGEPGRRPGSCTASIWLSRQEAEGLARRILLAIEGGAS